MDPSDYRVRIDGKIYTVDTTLHGHPAAYSFSEIPKPESLIPCMNISDPAAAPTLVNLLSRFEDDQQVVILAKAAEREDAGSFEFAGKYYASLGVFQYVCRNAKTIPCFLPMGKELEEKNVRLPRQFMFRYYEKPVYDVIILARIEN